MAKDDERGLKNVGNKSEIVWLNVGGSLYCTTRTTLTADPYSLLGKMFDEDSSFRAAAMKDDSGAYFIDRDGQIFAVIIEFLRSGKLWKWPQFERRRILYEAEYYGLQSLIDALLMEEEEEESEDNVKWKMHQDQDVDISLAKMWRSASLARQGKR